MKCWICQNNEADSSEHLIKGSDIRLHLGEVSQVKPLYRHIAGKRSVQVQSSKSDALKLSGSICHECNTTRTQRFDHAWEKMSLYIRSNHIQLAKSKQLFLKDVYGYDFKVMRHYAQLYFLKVFGCRLVEELPKVDVSNLRKHLLNSRACPNFFLAIALVERPTHDNRSAGVSDFTGSWSLDMSAIEVVGTAYQVGQLSIEMLYVPTGARNVALEGWWRASSVAEKIPLGIIR